VLFEERLENGRDSGNFGVKCFQAHFHLRFSIFDFIFSTEKIFCALGKLVFVFGMLKLLSNPFKVFCPEIFLAAGSPKLTFSLANGAIEDATNEDASLLRGGFRIPLDGVGIPVCFCTVDSSASAVLCLNHPKLSYSSLRGSQSI